MSVALFQTLHCALCTLIVGLNEKVYVLCLYETAQL